VFGITRSRAFDRSTDPLSAPPEISVTPRYRLAADALRPVAERLRADMQAKSSGPAESFEVPLQLSRHMDLVVDALRRFEGCIEQLSNEVLSNDAANATDAGRAAGRLEEALQTFVRGFRIVRASRPSADLEELSKEGRRLMMGVYRHFLKEVLEWIDRLVDALDDPIKVAQRANQALDSDITLTIRLTLTTPPQFRRLHEIASEVFATVTAQQPVLSFGVGIGTPAPVRSAPGPLAHLGALAFGLAVASRAFRRHRF
jgi:hypothetical protein